MHARRWLLLAFACGGPAGACVGDSTSTGDSGVDASKPPGTDGGPCFPNSTCNAGLVCVLENGAGICRPEPADATPDVASDATSDGSSDAAPSEAGPDATLVCTSATTLPSFGGFIGTSGVSLGGYYFRFVSPYDGGAILSVACSPDAGLFDYAWYCATDASTVLSRPLDYGTPPDAGRTITAHVTGATASNCSLSMTITAP